MAANDEYPRGWTVTQFIGPGVGGNIAIPASTGILHVLTFIELIVSSIAGATSSGLVSYTGAIGTITLGRYFADATGSAAAIQTVVSLECQLPSIAGGSISVTTTALSPSSDGLLIVKGYDI